MDKLIFIFLLIALTQCKTNKVAQTEEVIDNAVVTNDTITTEEDYVYRGDTLTCRVVMVDGSMISKTTYKKGHKGGMDGIAKSRRSKMGEPRVEMMESTVMMDESATAPRSETIPVKGKIKPNIPQNPEAGQLTAGEWNDLNNWEDWKSLLNDNEYFNMQDEWGIYPTQRYSVFITNQENTPLVDVKVDLRDGNKTIWTARTDHSGRAELWVGLSDKLTVAKSQLKAVTYIGSDSYEIEVTKGESAHLKIQNKCNSSNQVDIMFVVDATGSMGDEITYLKSELKDVIKRATQNSDDLNLRIGSVFYRDGQDAYLTKVSPLNTDLDKVYQFIDKQDASGGGDYPEAVDAAIEDALAQKWSDNAIARIMFLLLDAPPHGEEEIKSTIRDQIAEAAERGIKIIPISASGINRETEFLLKFMSIATNGTYVFITDDSGIGNPHLDPVVSDYEVEKLNDLLERLISNYTVVKECDEKVVINPEIKIYPNPTSNFITVEPTQSTLEVRLISASGMVLFKSRNTDVPVKIDLSQNVDGMYTVQCIGEDFTYSYPIIKVSE